MHPAALRHVVSADKYVKPVVSSHEIGWFVPAKVEQVDRIPNVSCPETIYAAKLHIMNQ